MNDITPVANGYRVIETPEIQSDDGGRECYAVVDRDEKVIWLYAGTPIAKIASAISEALQLAARVVELPVLALSA